MNQLSSGINRGRSGFTIRGATRPEKEKEICKAAQDSHPTYPVCKEGTVTKTFSDFVLPGDPPEPGKLDDEYFPHYLCVLDDNDGIANADSEPWLSNTNYACSGFNCTPDPASSTYNPALTRTPVSLKGSEFSIRGAENVSSLLASLYTRPGKNIYERKTDRCEEASSQIRISRTRNLIIECTKEAKGGAAFNLYVTGEQLINAFQNALSVCIPGAGYNESACNAIKANSEENATLYFKLPYVDLVNKSFANYTDSIIRPGKCTPETGAVGTLSGKGVISGEFKKAPYVSDGFGTPVTGKDIIYQTFDRPREPL